MIRKMLCEVCADSEHKYRCPRCRIVYCSLGCYKRHKESCTDQPKVNGQQAGIADTATVSEESCTDQPKVNEQQAGIADTATVVSEEREPVAEFDLPLEYSEDRVTPAQLQRLEQSEEVKAALENPHLRQIMTSLVAARNVDKLLEGAMQEPIFSEFADTCLHTINPRESSID